MSLPAYFVLCTVSAQSTCNSDLLSAESQMCLIQVWLSIYSDLSSLIVQISGAGDLFAQSGMLRVA